jgi:hypothetical protein
MAQHLHGLGEGVVTCFSSPTSTIWACTLRPWRFSLLGGRVGLVLARAPDADIGAGLGQRIGHAEADAAVAAGHQRDLAREIEALVGHGRPLPHSSPR